MRIGRDRLVAGKYALVQEVIRITLDGKLEISILKPFGDSFLKSFDQRFGRPDFYYPLNLCSRHQSQSEGSNNSEEAVSSVNQTEQLGARDDSVWIRHRVASPRLIQFALQFFF
jgi:hypothetical protein